jgi:hypothetical protein
MLRQSLRRANAADKLMEEATVERVTAEEYRAQTMSEDEAEEAAAETVEEAMEEPIAAESKGVTKTELNKMKVAELRERAAELGIDAEGLKKPELVDALYEELNK